MAMPIPSCAACNHRKRKCGPHCPLRRYFPANQPDIFENVRRLFTVAKITKMLAALNSDAERDICMQSIIHESNAWKQFPVEGCIGAIQHLKLQLQHAVQEWQRVEAQLAACRNHRHLFTNNAQPSSHGGAGPTNFEFATYPPSTNCLPGSTRFESGSGSSSMPPPPSDVGRTYFEFGVDPQYLSSEYPPSTNWLPGSTQFESGSGSSSMPPPPPPQANSISDLSAIQQQMGSFGIPRRRDQDFQESVMKSMDERLSLQIDRDRTEEAASSTFDIQQLLRQVDQDFQEWVMKSTDETLSLQIDRSDRTEEASSSFDIKQFLRLDQDSDETGDEVDEQETAAD